MQAAKDWALSLCSAAVLCAVFDILKPGGRYDKLLRLLLAAVVICAVISPLTDIGRCCADLSDISADFKQPGSDFADSLISQSADAMRGALRDLIAQRLDDLGITEYEISISMDTSPDGSISIGQVDVTLGRRYSQRIADARRALEELGINADVKAGGDI